MNHSMYSHKAALVLGTAQFGLPYGVTNTTGQLEQEDVHEIVAGAALSGVFTIDTAAAYGTSEEVLGRTLPPAQPWEIVTKTLPLASVPSGQAPVQTVMARFEQSLVLLQRSSVDALLVHHASDLIGAHADELYALLMMLKGKGYCRKIGVSVYTAAEIDAIVTRFPIDLIQLPYNALDQRLVRSGHLAGLHAAGIEIHVRSVFLQGILLTDPALLPSHLMDIAGPLEQLRQGWRDSSLDPVSGCLSGVIFRPEISCVVVGVTSPAEWQMIFRAHTKLSGPIAGHAPVVEKETLLDPSQWGTLAASLGGK